SAGVPESFVNETIVVPLNNTQAIEEAFTKFAHDIACVIIEPIPANNGLLLQDRVFLQFLRDTCTKHGSLLIFDEVISGFRIGFEGAAGYYGIAPDIITYGKIIGGGMPVGAYGSRKEIMNSIAPDGRVYQAGTLSGNPVAMSAGSAQLHRCLQNNFYEDLHAKTVFFAEKINLFAKQKKYSFKVISIGSIFWFAFTNKESIRSAGEIDPESMELFRIFYHDLLNSGIYLGPSGYEVGFISTAHTKEILEEASTKICRSL